MAGREGRGFFRGLCLIDICVDNESVVRKLALNFRPSVGRPKFIRYTKVNSSEPTAMAFWMKSPK
jgi:hypothetical protein